VIASVDLFLCGQFLKAQATARGSNRNRARTLFRRDATRPVARAMRAHLSGRTFFFPTGPGEPRKNSFFVMPRRRHIAKTLFLSRHAVGTTQKLFFRCATLSARHKNSFFDAPRCRHDTKTLFSMCHAVGTTQKLFFRCATLSARRKNSFCDVPTGKYVKKAPETCFLPGGD